MKILKSFYLLLLTAFLTSCSSENSDIALDVSNITLKISNIKLSEATVVYHGDFSGNTSRILYKEKGSTDDYQSFDLGGNIATLTNLQKATEYEVVFEASNNSSSLQSAPYYFSTKAVNFNYEKFYSKNLSSAFEVFSHLNKQHVIHAEGLSDYDNVKVYLVNEQKTDSLQLSSIVASDSLTFTIPNNYLSQEPRESVKKVWVGIKIKNSYKYLLNEIAWVNTVSNPNYSTEKDMNEVYLKLKIFNDKPFIDEVTLSENNSTSCPNNISLSFKGDFLGHWDSYYWTPNKADLVIFDSLGNLYNTFSYNYGNSSTNCDSFFISVAGLTTEEDSLTLYHQTRSAQAIISNLPTGKYSAKIVFSFENVLEGVETNIVEFEKM